MGVKVKTTYKGDLANAIQSVLLLKLDRRGEPRTAKLIVDTILKSIQESLARSGKIVVEGFGTFEVKYRAPHYNDGMIISGCGKNLVRGTTYVKEKYIVTFKPGKKLKRLLGGSSGDSQPS